jgi:hypothetical protein
VKTLKYLIVAGALILGASNSVAQKIPEFKRCYVADTKVPLVTADGPILWAGSSYNNSKIHELRGYIDLPIKVIGFIKGYTLHLGAITRFDSTTVESIIYTNTRTDEKLSDYDIMTAKREGINTKGLTSLWHEKYDYSDSTITNLETGSIRPMNNARDFQDIYFSLPKNKNLDTLVNVHFCGEDQRINIRINGEVIEADLTYPDPKDPSKTKELIEGILNMSAHIDKYGIPDRMVAGARMIVNFHPEAIYDSKREWMDLR